MGDDKDPSVPNASNTAPPEPPPAPMSVVPRPGEHSAPAAREHHADVAHAAAALVPRHLPGGRRAQYAALHAAAAASAPPDVHAGFVRGGFAQRGPARASHPSAARAGALGAAQFCSPSTPLPGGNSSAQLEQRLGATQVELRKLGSERHTLRARLRREADRLHELESALRAEKDLRTQASDEHFVAILALRSRLAEVEAERDAESARLRSELEQARAEAEQARTEAEQARAEAEQAHSQLERAGAELAQAHSRAADSESGAPVPARSNKVLQGLRRIRGIGPAYQRLLEQAGISRVQQIAVWTETELLAFADRLKIRPDRIVKDDWIGQAKLLEPDPDD